MLRSIKSQIILALSIIIIAILGATAYLLIDQKIREVNEDIFNKAISFAELTHERVINSFENNYQQQAYANFERELAEIYVLNQDIIGISIYSYDGTRLYTTDTYEKKPELDRIQANYPSVKILGSGRVIYLEQIEDQLRYTNFNGKEVNPIQETEQILNILYPFHDPNNITRNFTINYRVSYELLNSRIQQTVLRIGAIAVGGIVVALFIGYILAYGITRPIKMLSKGAAQIGKGDLKTRIQLKSKSEIGMLASTFNEMAADLEVSTRAMIAHERTAKELELASKIQRDLLPATLPQISSIDIAASIDSATEVGGDGYDFIEMKKQSSLLFYIADVTGHGVGAGLVSAVNNALITALLDHYSNTHDLVLNLNKILKLKTSPSVFVTMVLVMWNIKNNTLQFTQAGHDPILHYQAKEEKVVKLAHGGMALGMIADVSKVIKTEEVAVKKGDVLVLYTDGIPEAWQSDTEIYGMERFMASVEKHGKLDTAQAIHDALIKDVRDFMGDHIQEDDITLMVLKRTK